MSLGQVKEFISQYAPELGTLSDAYGGTAWNNAAYATLLNQIHNAGGEGFAAITVVKKHLFAMVQDCFSFDIFRRDVATLVSAQRAYAAGTASLEQYIQATIQCNLWEDEIRNARIWYREMKSGDRVRIARGKGIGDMWLLNGRDITNYAGAVSAYHYALYQGKAIEADERDGGRIYSVIVVL